MQISKVGVILYEAVYKELVGKYKHRLNFKIAHSFLFIMVCI